MEMRGEWGDTGTEGFWSGQRDLWAESRVRGTNKVGDGVGVGGVKGEGG